MMNNQARASRHASGILPSKQFFAPRKPISQTARRTSTSSPNPPPPTYQTTTTTTTANNTTLTSTFSNIQSEEVSLLHQPSNTRSSIPIPPNQSLDQSLDSLFSPELSQGVPGRTLEPSRPTSALLLRRLYRQPSGNDELTQNAIDSVLEPIAQVSESTYYHQNNGSNLISRDFAFSKHSENITSNMKLNIITSKSHSSAPTKYPANSYASAVKYMPRIIPQPTSMHHANDNNKRGRRRLYQNWPGRNRFFLGGRVMTSRDFPAFLVAFSALIVPSGLFMGFTCPYLFHNVSPALVFVFVYLFLLAATSMLKTSWSDPGIIPRNLDPSPPTEDLEDPENNANNTNNNPYYPPHGVPLPKEVKINGQTVRLKYCDSCKIYRPPRCSHCRQCDNCVENEDHHCIWLNNCIGKRNYRSFFTFIATATILCFYVLGSCLTHLFMLMKEKNTNFISSIVDAPVSFVLLILSFFLMWSVGGLTGYHTYLISKNLTTHEQIRVPLARRNGNRNPFDYRNIYRNCLWVLCRPMTRSYVSRRAFIEEEGDDDEDTLNNTSTQPTNNTNTETTNPETTNVIGISTNKELTNTEHTTTTTPISESREQQEQLDVNVV